VTKKLKKLNELFSSNNSALCKTIKKSVDLKVKKIKSMPKIKKTSAILFINIAFKAALIAKTLVYQKLINKNEHKPTPSQPKKSCIKFEEVTKTIIKKVKRDK